MGRKRKPDASFWESLAARRARKDEQARLEREEAEQDAAERRDTKRLLREVAFGKKGEPVDDWDAERILIDNPSWAGSIVELARAWCVTPGRDELDADPLRDTGCGIEAGRHIFELACSGATRQKIANELDEARKTLGIHGDEQSGFDHAYGVIFFFRQLSKYYVNGRWTPPRSKKLRRAEALALAMLRRTSPGFLTHQQLAKAAGWNCNGRNLARNLRNAEYPIESARAARKADPSISKAAKGYRLQGF